jgi:hypothetical protein
LLLSRTCFSPELASLQNLLSTELALSRTCFIQNFASCPRTSLLRSFSQNFPQNSLFPQLPYGTGLQINHFSKLPKTGNPFFSGTIRSANNSNALIKDLFHVPPSFKTKIVLSWKPQDQVRKLLFR